MAKGSEQFNFEFLLMDVIPITCNCIFRFGEVESLNPTFQGRTINISEHLYDDENDFITLAEYLLDMAQELYENENVIIFEPES